MSQGAFLVLALVSAQPKKIVGVRGEQEGFCTCTPPAKKKLRSCVQCPAVRRHREPASLIRFFSCRAVHRDKVATGNPVADGPNHGTIVC